MLTVFFTYAIMYIILQDVIKAKNYQFNIRQLAYILLFGYFLYFSYHRVFGKHIKYMRNRKILLFVLASFFLVYGVQFFVITRIEKKIYDTKEFANPLYPKYKAIGEKYHLDLSFTKIVKDQRGPVNYKINTIYALKPKSVDILLLGDSSIAWDVIPEVIEQITHKKVAMFAYESNYMTEKTAKLFDRISRYYLKDDGLLIVSFANPFYDKNPQSIPISKKEYDQMVSWSDKEFATFAKSQENKKFNVISNQTAIMEPGTDGTFEEQKDNASSLFSYSKYQDHYNTFSDYLSETLHMHLNSAKFYTRYLEKYINPAWNRNKNVNTKDGTTMHLRWNLNTVTLYDPNFNHFSTHFEVQSTTVLNNSYMEKNAEAAASIYGNNKLFMVPIYDKNEYYITSSNIYETYYKKHGFGLFNLGLLHPKNEKYPMQGGAHMSHEGGLMKSILIGEWLKKHQKD